MHAETWRNKDERTQFFRKIYLSFYWKGCVWEGVGDRTKTATYWPQNSSGYHSLSFPFSWFTQLGASEAGTCFSFQHLLSNWSELPVAGLYNYLTFTYFLRGSQFALNSTPWQSRSPLISWYLRPDVPVIYTGAFLLLTAWPGRRSIWNTMMIILTD